MSTNLSHPYRAEPWSQTQGDGWCIYSNNGGVMVLEESHPYDTQLDYILPRLRQSAHNRALAMVAVRVQGQLGDGELPPVLDLECSSVNPQGRYQDPPLEWEDPS